MKRDVLAHMDFAPIVEHVKTMDEVIFSTAPMDLREILLRLPLEARFKYNADQNVLFLNFEKLEVKSLADVEAIRRNVARLCEPLGHKVYAVVNYDGFSADARCRGRLPGDGAGRGRAILSGRDALYDELVHARELGTALAGRGAARTSMRRSRKHAKAWPPQ